MHGFGGNAEGMGLYLFYITSFRYEKVSNLMCRTHTVYTQYTQPDVSFLYFVLVTVLVLSLAVVLIGLFPNCVDLFCVYSKSSNNIHRWRRSDDVLARGRCWSDDIFIGSSAVTSLLESGWRYDFFIRGGAATLAIMVLVFPYYAALPLIL